MTSQKKLLICSSLEKYKDYLFLFFHRIDLVNEGSSNGYLFCSGLMAQIYYSEVPAIQNMYSTNKVELFWSWHGPS